MRGAIPLAGWAVLLAVNDAVLWGFGPGILPGACLGAAALATALLAAWVAWRRRGGEDVAREPRRRPDVSFSIVVVALGLTAVAAGLFVGAWLWIIAGGVVVLGAAGLAREWRAT